LKLNNFKRWELLVLVNFLELGGAHEKI